jgi:hypothetical protein
MILTLGWITLFMGDMGEEALHREDEVAVKEIKISGTKTNWPTDRTCVIALQITDPL